MKEKSAAAALAYPIKWVRRANPHLGVLRSHDGDIAVKSTRDDAVWCSMT